MIQSKTSSRTKRVIGAAFVACILVVLFIYIMIAKPNYRAMNGVAHAIIPIANWTGDIVSWPFRIIGKTAHNIHELSHLRTENEELRVRLDEALLDQNRCTVAMEENKKLTNELKIVQSFPEKAIIADVIYDNSVFHHSTFLINRGRHDGIEKGMVVVSTRGVLAGTVIDVGENFSRVRALTDSDTNIAVRIAGSDIYGFLRGNGSNKATVGFFNDPNFKPTNNQQLITSNISGVLPNGIVIGNMRNETDVDILRPSKLSRVVVLKFNSNNKYK